MNTLVNETTLPVTVDAKALEAVGLELVDLPAAQAIADKLNLSEPGALATFGRGAGEKTSRYADSLLAQVKNRDLDDAGKKLGQVVTAAQSLNLHALSNRRSRLPIIGPLIDRFRLTKDQVIAQFESTEQQIATLVNEVEFTQKNLSERNQTMYEMYDAVKSEHRELGLYIVAGKIKLDTLKAELAAAKDAGTPLGEYETQDRNASITKLEKRVADLQVLQHSALQTLPMIRMLQANGELLIDKFHNIKELTLPAWKNQFSLRLFINEQRNTVGMAKTIDDATNTFLRDSADLLKENSIETAKSNQRLVIDVETLVHVNETLINTVNDVVRITQQGARERANVEQQLTALRAGMKQSLLQDSSVVSVQ